MPTDTIPAGFTDAFLDWFRERTEAAWATYQETPFQRYVAAQIGGVDWQRGGRWLGGLTETQIERVEHHWSLSFPPDYRRFLRRLHALDRPQRGTGFGAWSPGQPPSDKMIPAETPAFYNWLTDEQALQDRWEGLSEGLHFDVERNNLWPASWGQRPATEAARLARVRELVASARRLIPIFAHRYLLAEPCAEDNPVFSIYQSDIIVYGPNLRNYFLVEFADLLGIDARAAQRDADQEIARQSAGWAEIPFWGELCFSA